MDRAISMAQKAQIMALINVCAGSRGGYGGAASQTTITPDASDRQGLPFGGSTAVWQR
ncbi:hypothetical protein AB0J72_15515 [Dactylosporangium sp. NPDC049742]|uniref:hypothetical protein n=1 Tax=Dactylosporangium sp. NPDC049742 TaxID=3154737 RepID=UPI00341C41F1